MKRAWTQLLLSTALTAGVCPPAAAQVTANPTGDPVADAKIAADLQLEPTTENAGTAGEIVVTGTRIVRPNNRSAAPITSTTAAEIAAQGALTIEEVLNRLPQVAPNSEQNYSDSEGRQRVKLRNLGFERTLTLIDGLRTGVGIAAGLDTSIIPTVLVERVDVLTGGASSVYGSDAVAGVVNYILKKNFDGISLTGRYSLYNHENRENRVTAAARQFGFSPSLGYANDGGRADVALTVGKSFFDGDLNVAGFVNYRHSDDVPLGNRSYSSCEVIQATVDGPLSCTRASFTPAGTIIPQSGPRAGQTLVNNPDGSGTFVPINSLPGTSANPYDGFSVQRAFDRLNAGGFVTLKLADEIELYSNTLWYRDRSRNPLLNRTLNFGFYASGPYQVNCDNVFLSASQARDLCGTAAGTSAKAPLDVRYRFDGAPPLENKFENKGLRIVGGARGQLFDGAWNYDIAGVYARSQSLSTGQSFPDFARVNRSLNVVNRNGTPTCVSVIDGTDPACVPFNAFAPNNSDAALQNYLFTATANLGSSGSDTRLWQGLVSIGVDLGKYGITSPLAEQGIAVAVAAEYRDEKFKSFASPTFRQFNGGTDAVATQNVWEGNIEVQVPLVEKKRWTDLLQVNGGYRKSKYNQLDDTFDTYKVEGLWAPIADITFRGSYNKAQRAPNVIEATRAANVAFSNVNAPNDPCATTPDPQNPGRTAAPRASIEACRASGLPDNLYGSATLSCPELQCTTRNGGFGLRPETAYTKTFGVVLRPRFLPGLTLSVDRFLIDLDDSLGFSSASDYVNSCITFKDAFGCRGLIRNPGTFTLFSPAGTNPTAGFFIQGDVNSFKVKSYGWDVQAQYTVDMKTAGSLNLDFNGSRPTLQGGQDAPQTPQRNCAGLYGPLCGEGFPKWTHGLRTTYTSPDKVFGLSLNWRYIGPMTLTYNAENPTELGLPFTAADRRVTNGRIDEYNYIDLAVTFDIAKRFTVSMSVNNLFDKDPPLVVGSRELLGLLRNNTLFRYDFLGRQLVVGATARF